MFLLLGKRKNKERITRPYQLIIFYSPYQLIIFYIIVFMVGLKPNVDILDQFR